MYGYWTGTGRACTRACTLPGYIMPEHATPSTGRVRQCGHAGKEPSRHGRALHAQPDSSYGLVGLVIVGTRTGLVSRLVLILIQYINQG